MATEFVCVKCKVLTALSNEHNESPYDQSHLEQDRMAQMGEDAKPKSKLGRDYTNLRKSLKILI